jgi:ribosomal protein S18 acetylase RimI-like enzyme|tara:strand:- start:311 stop:469 length:159 start_codon:yes stop_codon:yes gene_type:complete
MNVVIDEARALDLAIELQVLRVNPNAVEFYRRLGFTVVGESETHIQMRLDKE